MLLRLMVYWALAVDAIARHHLILSLVCFGIPFAGPVGMFLAFLAGIGFLVQGLYLEGFLAIGLVIFNLVGNKIVEKRSEGNRPAASVEQVSPAAPSPKKSFCLTEEDFVKGNFR